MKNRVSENSDAAFPLVAIGASAGGLESLKVFFENLSPDLNAAYVVIQHLSPDYKSHMQDLISRYTDIPVCYAADGISIEPGTIYLIPPARNLQVFNNTLITTEQKDKLNLPIDVFLHSLARDRKERAIAVIMSGTGSDGTLGCRSIKEFGGMIISQDSHSAQFDGMPKNLIATGIVDSVLPPTDIAHELKQYLNHPFIKRLSQKIPPVSQDETGLLKIFNLIKIKKNIDFSLYKRSTILRQLEKRITINQLTDLDSYIDFLERHPEEIDRLSKDFLIGVTRFFRDRDAFTILKEKVIPAIFASKGESESIRLWSLSCSTGEEAYSLAILFKEYMQQHRIHKDVKIFATDIDEDSINYAGNGIYPDSIVSDISSDLLARYFSRTERGLQIKKVIRNMVVFAKHNILNDPPFSRIDLISCRNMLIYLNKDTQKKILNLLYYSLHEGSYLFLGSSEAITTLAEGFDTVDTKWKVYKYKPGLQPPVPSGLPISAGLRISTTSDRSRKTAHSTPEDLPDLSIGSPLFDSLISPLLPPSVIIDHSYNIIYLFKGAKKYLTIPDGAMSTRLTDMVDEPLSIALNSILKKGDKREGEVLYNNVHLHDSRTIDMGLHTFINRRNGRTYYLISFMERSRSDTAVPRNKNDGEDSDYSAEEEYRDIIQNLERELLTKDENLQATVEELESSNEELQTSNEELIASNEELQSTNEELESVNEELYTVNSEHQEKIRELTELNDDIRNLMKSTKIGALFLDNHLRIRKFTDIIEDITPIRNADIGRPVEHLSTNTLYADFIDDVKAVSDTLQPIVKDPIQCGEEWYTLKIIPYRDTENAVTGIIVTFIDASKIIRAEKRKKKLAKRLETALGAGNMAWWEWNVPENRVITSPEKALHLGYSPDELGENYQEWTKLIHPDDYEKTMDAMKQHLSGKTESYIVTYRIRAKDGRYLLFKDTGGIVERNTDGSPRLVTGIVIMSEEEPTG
ncbi:MAG: CheR family methyltransferase [Fibrobacterota bacterium]